MCEKKKETACVLQEQMLRKKFASTAMIIIDMKSQKKFKKFQKIELLNNSVENVVGVL